MFRRELDVNDNDAYYLWTRFCACLGCLSLTGVAAWLWATVIWEAMKKGGVDFTGRILITVLGPMEGFISASSGVGVCMGAALGALLYCCIKACNATGACPSNEEDSSVSYPAIEIEETPSVQTIETAISLLKSHPDLINEFSLLLEQRKSKKISAQAYEQQLAGITSKAVSKGMILEADAQEFTTRFKNFGNHVEEIAADKSISEHTIRVNTSGDAAVIDIAPKKEVIEITKGSILTV